MVIKDVLVVQVAGDQLRNPPVKFRHERWLHLAVDQHPACPNRTRRELWPRKWFLLGRNPWLGLLCGLRLKSICVQLKKKIRCKALVGVCVCVCVCVIVAQWVGWADVGLWVAVCFLAKISLHRSTCKTTFARLTQPQAISQSFCVFISFRSMRDTTFFHFSKLFLIQNYRFLYIGDQKISWWAFQVASTSKSTCELPAGTLTAFGDRSASSMSK